jgi:hypothetical protein
MMSSSAPTRIGLVQPHSFIDAAIRATCSRLCVRGLLDRGIRRSIGQRSIWMSTLPNSHGLDVWMASPIIETIG